jgi:hypothetical protein
MPDPCRSCPKREVDFGGCRCQAALLTGDAVNADPACELSRHHYFVREVFDRGTHQSAIGVASLGKSVCLDANPTIDGALFGFLKMRFHETLAQ